MGHRLGSLVSGRGRLPPAVKEPGGVHVRCGLVSEPFDQGDERQQQQLQNSARDQQSDEQNDDRQVEEEHPAHCGNVTGRVAEDGLWSALVMVPRLWVATVGLTA